MRKRMIGVVLFGVGAALAMFHPSWFHSTRYGQLKCVINNNTGFAHMTRGMNGGTIDALQRAVDLEDIPVLVNMLDDSDSVTRMTAEQVLERMGHAPKSREQRP